VFYASTIIKTCHICKYEDKFFFPPRVVTPTLELLEVVMNCHNYIDIFTDDQWFYISVYPTFTAVLSSYKDCLMKLYSVAPNFLTFRMLVFSSDKN